MRFYSAYTLFSLDRLRELFFFYFSFCVSCLSIYTFSLLLFAMELKWYHCVALLLLVVGMVVAWLSMRLPAIEFLRKFMMWFRSIGIIYLAHAHARPLFYFIYDFIFDRNKTRNKYEKKTAFYLLKIFSWVSSLTQTVCVNHNNIACLSSETIYSQNNFFVLLFLANWSMNFCNRNANRF